MAVKKWEYELVNYSSTSKSMEEVKRLGKEGWRVISANFINGPNVFLEREILEPTSSNLDKDKLRAIYRVMERIDLNGPQKEIAVSRIINAENAELLLNLIARWAPETAEKPAENKPPASNLIPGNLRRGSV